MHKISTSQVEEADNTNKSERDRERETKIYVYKEREREIVVIRQNGGQNFIILKRDIDIKIHREREM